VEGAGVDVNFEKKTKKQYNIIDFFLKPKSATPVLAS